MCLDFLCLHIWKTLQQQQRNNHYFLCPWMMSSPGQQPLTYHRGGIFWLRIMLTGRPPSHLKHHADCVNKRNVNLKLEAAERKRGGVLWWMRRTTAIWSHLTLSLLPCSCQRQLLFNPVNTHTHNHTHTHIVWAVICFCSLWATEDIFLRDFSLRLPEPLSCSPSPQPAQHQTVLMEVWAFYFSCFKLTRYCHRVDNICIWYDYNFNIF